MQEGLERAWKLVAPVAGAIISTIVRRRANPKLFEGWADKLREAADVLDSLRPPR